MKYRLLLLFLVAFITVSKAQLPENKLLNKPFPEINGETLTGKKIDKAYFKSKVTLVNFMFIGCMPCMKEIGALNELFHNYKSNQGFQVLGISANTKNQLIHFNADDTTIYSRIRKTLKTDPIAYDLMAGCEKERLKPANSLGAECNDLSQQFYFNGYPISFLIDKKGIVRKVFPGFPISKSEGFAIGEDGKVTIVGGAEVSQEFLQKMQSEIDKIMTE